MSIAVGILNSEKKPVDCTVRLKVNGLEVETRSVSVGAAEQEQVGFQFTPASLGSYKVDVNGQVGTFDAVRPAHFVASSLTLSPDPPLAGREIQVAILLSNDGELPGSYLAVFVVDEDVVGSRDVQLDAGQSVALTEKFTPVSYGAHVIQYCGVTQSIDVQNPNAVLTVGYLKSNKCVSNWTTKLGPTTMSASGLVVGVKNREITLVEYANPYSGQQISVYIGPEVLVVQHEMNQFTDIEPDALYPYPTTWPHARRIAVEDIKPSDHVQIMMWVMPDETIGVEWVYRIDYTVPATTVLPPKPPPKQDPLVTFADLALEKAVRDAIGKPSGDIHQSDVSSLTLLNARSKGVSNLTGLEYCVRLRNLYLDKNQITDVSPLGELHNLIEVSIGSNLIKDSRPLTTNHPYMINLWLRGNQISDLTPLANLAGTTLQWLDLSGNQITDISSVGGLIGLRNLSLSYNKIKDISAIAKLTNLNYLYLAHNEISDMSALGNIRILMELTLNNNRISDISSLGITLITAQARVDLSSNLISDISPLVSRGLGAGGKLNLQDNPLGPESVNTYIPRLKARGVDVQY
ncbi:MAG: leucine-rich repeat domain-containing protein [Dehalococcoidia bacterium]|nr:leucine-rich repeat domain-containing protein [Dehalococcoidia bacterium]